MTSGEASSGSWPSRPGEGLPEAAEVPPEDAEVPPEDLAQLVPWISERLDALDALDDADRARVIAVLDGIDVLHRQGLTRFVRLVRDLGGAGLLARIADDPAVGTLLDLYELREGSSPGSEVRPPAPEGGALVALRRPTWRSLGSAEDIPEGRLEARRLEGQPLLVLRFGSAVHAYRDGCPPGSALLLVSGRLEGTTIICPWHGCRYDARTGRRTDGDGDRERPGLPVLPVAIREGELRIAVGTEVVDG